MNRHERRAAAHAANEEARLLARAMRWALATGYIKSAAKGDQPDSVELRLTYDIERASQACESFNRRERAIIAAACERKRVRLATAATAEVAPLSEAPAAEVD